MLKYIQLLAIPFLLVLLIQQSDCFVNRMNSRSLIISQRHLLSTFRSHKLFASNLSVTSTYKDSDHQSIKFDVASHFDYSGDMICIPFIKPSLKSQGIEFINALKANIPSGLPSNIKTIVEEIIDEGNFKADTDTKAIIRVAGSGLAIKYISLLGLGKLNNDNDHFGSATAFNVGKSLTNIIKDTKVKSIGLVSSSMSTADSKDVILGLHDGSYADNRYKKLPPDGFEKFSLTSLSFLGFSCSSSELSTMISHSSIIASGVSFAKDLVNAPPNSCNPDVVSELSRKLAKEYKLECNILGAKECEELGMGGYLGVQQGSKYEPQFIHLVYKPDAAASDVVKVALVGKGLTFDSGGYNLKTGAGSMIELMKFDMGGCAAVLGACKAIAQLKPKHVEVHFITAVCENMISSEAMKPGDVLTASNGKTIEVGNTDAEGRLTLADALVFAERLKVHQVVDLATLTGACIVGLGEKLAGVYSNDEKLMEDLLASSKRSNEGLWKMPLEASYKENFKSSIADLKNVGSKGGGSITAALFLSEFVENVSWAHIDMAGPVWDTTNNKASGFGVKLLVDYLINLKK